MARSNWKALQSEKGHVNVSKTNKKRRRRSTRLKKEPVITEETKEAVKSSKPSHMNISNIIDQVKASSPPKKKVKISETKADESAIVEVKKSKKSKRKAKSEKKDDATTKSKSKKKRAKKAIDTDKDTKKVKAKTSQTKAETAEKPKPTEKKDSETLQLDASLDVVHAKMILAQKQVPRKYTQGYVCALSECVCVYGYPSMIEFSVPPPPVWLRWIVRWLASVPVVNAMHSHVSLLSILTAM